MIISDIGGFAATGSEPTDEAGLLALTGQVGYKWDIKNDCLEWSSNCSRVLGIENSAHIATGRAFDSLITCSHGPDRRGAVETITCAAPTRYQCIYSIATCPESRTIWLEDSGIAYPGGDGRPARAAGVVRRIRELGGAFPSEHAQARTGDRRYLEYLVEEALADCRRNCGEASLFVIEVGRLQLINDLYGFAAGDEILLRCAAVLRRFVGVRDRLVRISGAKFALIKQDCPAGETYRMARHMLSQLKTGVRRTGFGPVSLQAWIGAARMPRELCDTNEIIAAAVSACDEASCAGDLKVHIFENNPEIRAKRYNDAKLAAMVTESIGSGLLQLAFQPVVEAASGQTAFHEALVRMGACPESVIGADRFVPVAEKLGFINRVDSFALRRSVELLKTHDDAHLSINVSNETVENADWLSALAGLVEGRQDVARRLIVEITESRAASDLEETYKFVTIVKSLGCKVAIDDFGAGYTSFSNLKALPIDIIKIDGSFASNVQTDRYNGVFIRSLLELARAFEVKTVVEWIEDETTAMILADWGIDYLQGHRFGIASLDLPWSVNPPGDGSDTKRSAEEIITSG